MPDNFDPDAWPHGGGATPANGRGSEPSPSSSRDAAASDDDFDPFGFNDDPVTPEDRDDDFGNFSYDFDDDPATRTTRSPVVTPRRQDEDDDLYNDDPYASPYSNRMVDDIDDEVGTGAAYDDYDRYDDFDREPQDGGNAKRALIGAAAVLFFIGALGFGAMSLIRDGNKETVKPEVASENQQRQPVENAAPPAPANNEVPQGDVAAQPPAAVKKALDDALKAWGQFSVNGDLELVKPHFVNGSSQYAHLQDESRTLKAKPVAGPPFTMVMSNDATWTKAANGYWKVNGTVVASRPGEQDQSFRWEFTLSRAAENEPWQILQVRQF